MLFEVRHPRYVEPKLLNGKSTVKTQLYLLAGHRRGTERIAPHTGVHSILLSVGLPIANAPDVLLQPCGLLYYP